MCRKHLWRFSIAHILSQRSVGRILKLERPALFETYDRKVALSEIYVQGNGEPLGEGLLGAVRESRGHGPLDGRHQREAFAWIYGHYCFHKKPFIINQRVITRK